MRYAPSRTPPKSPAIAITRASTEVENREIQSLVDALGEWDTLEAGKLGIDEQAVASFYYRDGKGGPEEFAPPDGCMLLATHDGKTAGCIGFHKMEDGICEMKHFYVRPEFRGARIGRRLLDVLLAAARERGYRVMRLETTTFMANARRLYASMGFQVRDAYYDIPELFRPVTVFMERSLE
ncbi:MAG: GNAT family N-acetyltransferase [Candidatus Eiseniibacteriota bacterium]